jgi:hypothetical protein
MMTEITGETSIVIQVPSQKLYEYLLDFTRHPEWVENLQCVRQESGGPIHVGTTFQTQEGPPPVTFGQKLPMMFYSSYVILLPHQCEENTRKISYGARWHGRKHSFFKIVCHQPGIEYNRLETTVES